MDSVPMVAFTGQVPSSMLGNDAFQEADIVGITRPITKHNFLVRDIKDLASTIKKAFFIASTGRPGPVLVDLPKDVLNSQYEFEYPEKIDIRGYKPNYKGHFNQIKKAAEIIQNAKRPLLYVGGGVIMSGGSAELTLLAKENNLPVTMTLQGLGAFPGTASQSLGMLGMHGTYYANQAVNDCDVLVALGARFDDRVTGNIEKFATGAYKIHVDIDPTAIDKNVLVDLPIVGDVKHILAELVAEISKKPDTDAWWEKIEDWKNECPLDYDQDEDELKTQYVIERISEKTKGEAVIIADVGQHQMWVAQYYKFNNPRSHLTSGGLGTMGFSVPAAIGAAFAVNDRHIISISGDGGFQMNMQELITAAYHKLPIKFFIMNNCFLGMVRQWQTLFYDKRHSETDLSVQPDFVKLSEAFGGIGYRVKTKEEFDAALKDAVEKDVVAFIEVIVERMENVMPMVPSGGSLFNMMLLEKKETK
ncbi:MAG: biosynthetic-type acetolactate synthase large subunit, partial [Sulfurimonas sp.]|nr:biosynthetic-type acetolactate synthase large subunit [Sulfurimonas sp.]